jgi:hypothetical protein
MRERFACGPFRRDGFCFEGLDLILRVTVPQQHMIENGIIDTAFNCREETTSTSVT